MRRAAALAAAAVAALVLSAPSIAHAAPVDTLPPTASTTASGSSGSTGTIDTIAPVGSGGDSAVDPIATPGSIPTPKVTSSNDSIVINTPQGTSNALMLVLLVTLAGIVPGLLMLTTTFPRFLIVLGLTRQGLGLNSTPPNQVLAGLAAFLTLFVMGPTFSKVNEIAIQPALHGKITQGEAVKEAWVPMREFMLVRTRTSDLAMLYDLTHTKRPTDHAKVSPRFLIPAFILSELRAAFIIGFLIWVPFLLIDLIVSTVLASLGMLMMPPVVVSLPVKIALFVLVDGWSLLIGSLLRSAGVA